MPSQLVDNAEDGVGDYVEMSSASQDQLTPFEIARLRRFLNTGALREPHHPLQQPQQQKRCSSILEESPSIDSDHTEFMESTHAWCVRKKQNDTSKKIDRMIGAVIISFQLFTYYLFAAEAIEDYQYGAVQVFTSHDNCIDSDFSPQENLQCEAEKTYLGDVFVSFFMLSIFLAADVQQAFRSIKAAWRISWGALAATFFVALEILCAFLAASISISQKLYTGEVTDAIEAGVGLLFIRELSTKAYHGMRQKKKKTYWSFSFVMVIAIVLGMIVHPVCVFFLAP